MRRLSLREKSLRSSTLRPIKLPFVGQVEHPVRRAGSTTPRCRSDADQKLTHPARSALIENFRAEMPVSVPFTGVELKPEGMPRSLPQHPSFSVRKKQDSYSRWLSPAERSSYDPATPAAVPRGFRAKPIGKANRCWHPGIDEQHTYVGKRPS